MALRQQQLRSILRQNAAKSLPSKFCEYNEKNQLICKICKTAIKLWKSHEKSHKHQQNVQRLLQLKARRQQSSKDEKNTNDDDGNVNDTLGNGKCCSNDGATHPGEIQKSDEPVVPEPETEQSEETLIDGLPLDFFDKSMQYMKPKNKKESTSTSTVKQQQSASENEPNRSTTQSHVVMVEVEHEAKEGMDKKRVDDDDTGKALLKLENEMKIEQNKQEEELLEFIKEIDAKMDEEEDKELQFQINHLKQYKTKLNQKKRIEPESNNATDLAPPPPPPHKKPKFDTPQPLQPKGNDCDNDDSDSGDDDDIDLGLDFGGWRTQKL